MRSIFALLAVAAAVSGCASVSHNVADKGTLTALAGQAVTYTIAEPASFVLSTPENNRVPLMRVSLMIKEGAQVLADNNIPDPAVAIANGIAQQLAQNYKTRLVPPAATPAASGARVSIDVKTTNWGLFYTGADNGKYGLVTSMTVQLVDIPKGSVIAGGTCKPGSASSIPTHGRDELLANGAAVLKAELNRVVTNCVDFISKQVLAL